MALSLNPKTFVLGGLPVGEMEVVGAAYEVYDFNGKASQEYAAPTVLRLDLKLADGSEHAEHLSAGSSDRVVPSGDGNELDGQNENVTGIGKSTALAMFIESLVTAGFPEPKLDGKASSFVGMRFICSRPPVKGDDGATKKRKDGKGREFDVQWFKCEKILALPGEKGKKAAAPKPAAAKAKPAAAAPAADNGDSEDVNPEIAAMAQEMVMTVLSEAGGKMALMNLKVKLFGAVKSLDAETKTAVLKLANSPEWLAENGFTVQGKDISA